MARFALSGTSLESRLGGFVYLNESLFKPQDDRFYFVLTRVGIIVPYLLLFSQMYHRAKRHMQRIGSKNTP